MILSHRNKFIFLAFNKTGTTRIEHALRKYNSRLAHYRLRLKHRRTGSRIMFKHISAPQARELVGHDVWESYFTFTFARNPWSRLVSLYAYHRQKPANRYPLAQKPFREWLLNG